MSEIVQRGNTVFLAFTFIDEDDETTAVDSAEVELTYPGRDGFATETLTLTLSTGAWRTTWDSTKARAGWVHWHAHGISAQNGDFAQDGRFKLTANRASYQHDVLPTGGTLTDPGTPPTDYA